MKTTGCCLALLGLLFTAAFAVSSPATREIDKDRFVVDKVIRDSIGWALTKDRARLESIMAHDTGFFIFHPEGDDTVVGWDAFVPSIDFFMDPRFVAISSDVRDLRIHFSRSGDVAWYSCILDDFGTWDGRPASWENTRWTGVLEKRDGTWVIVQMHFSFAAKQVREEAKTKGQEP